MQITIEPLKKITGGAQGVQRCAVLDFGFRIFFLLGASSALLLVLAWIAVYALGWRAPNHFDLPQWHAHEMLFGFAVAIIAGFLLTAPATWTGRPMPTGPALGSLALVWVLGRVVEFLPSYLPPWAIAAVDVAFLPLLAAVVLRVVWQARQLRNAVFPVVLLVMTAANVLSHLHLRTPGGQSLGTELMLYLILFMIATVAGRVIPGFTRARLPAARCLAHPVLDACAAAALIALIVADLSGWPPSWVAGLALTAAALHGARWFGWHSPAVWRVPLLWILYVAYAWIVLGFLLKAGSVLGLVPLQLHRHAFTVGGIGTITLGMMCRVSLGHTGRRLDIGPVTILAFGLISLAAVARVLLPLFAPGRYLLWVEIAGFAWVAAFLLYLVQYGPLLLRPRADGRPG